MLPTNRLDASAQSGQPNVAPEGDAAPDATVLLELRKDLAAIVAEFAKVVEQRAAEAKAAAAAGMERALLETRLTIRSHPVAAAAVALLLGAGLALAVLPALRPSRKARRLPDWSLPAIPAAYLQTARDLPHAISGSTAMASMASAFERLVEQISTIDPKASLTPALEKAGSWLTGLRTAAGGR